MPTTHPQRPAAPLSDLSDAALMRGVKSGLPGADAELASRYRSTLVGLFAYFLRRSRLPMDDAEDLAHEALLRVFTRCHQFEGERFTAWLNALARNLFVSSLRRRQTDPLYGTVPLEHAGDCLRARGQQATADTDPATRELHCDLRAALDSLPEQQQRIVRLHGTGLSLRVIAAMIGLPAGTVKGRLRAAHQRLGRQLRYRGWNPTT